MKIAAALLGGGLSSRMGQDKSKLEIDNQSLKQRQISILESCNIEQIFVCDNQQIKDRFEKKGPLGAIDALFQVDDFLDFDFCICLPVDMPNLNQDSINQLIQFAINSNQSVAFTNSILPLVFKVNRQTKQWLDNQLTTETNWSINHFSRFLNTHFIDIDDHYLININTPQQWEEYLNHERI
ncbi:molybdenum cofactor guanylyltransferase [Marinicellulosiphila megalodicopiae]|uniref:molybdenum cofactor guanylyltransferase n=1 Tax=Marinicellulosiphila megalodicopiae TaxID=2724896 RepID=UPI003BB1CE82